MAGHYQRKARGVGEKHETSSFAPEEDMAKGQGKHHIGEHFARENSAQKVGQGGRNEKVQGVPFEDEDQHGCKQGHCVFSLRRCMSFQKNVKQ